VILVRGSIYFHSEFGFHDGDIGKKFIILINNPQNSEPFLFLKVTSQPTNKPSVYGCHFKRKVFFIPSGKVYFRKDTWVQLHEIYAFSPVKLIKDGINKILTPKDKLPEQMANEIVNCLLKSNIEDIELEHLRLIKKR
jgi:hypothetical protein